MFKNLHPVTVTFFSKQRQTLQRTKLFILKQSIMLDFITIPLIVGIVTLGIYKLFELFARKKERMALIEKLGEKLNPEILDTKISFPLRLTGDKTFGTLKVGSLLLGVGLGLLIGFFISYFYYGNANINDYYIREMVGVIYGASVLLFGGLGLVVSFIIELKLSKKKD